MSVALNLFEDNSLKQINRSDLPPMLRQYLEYKDTYPDCILLFQVGDFYEAFFEDAKILAKTINLTLTSRDKSSDNPIPMAGMPISVVDTHLARLVSAGLSVAIVSQEVVPENFKGSVPRKLERILTPGVTVSSNTLNSSEDSIVASLGFEAGWCEQSGNGIEYVVSYADVTAGQISIKQGTGLDSLISDLLTIMPVEVILPQQIGLHKVDRRMSWYKRLELMLPATSFKFRNIIVGQSYNNRQLAEISGYSIQAPLAKSSIRMFIQYVDEITVNAQLPFQSINSATKQGTLIIDATTRKNLELVNNIKDNSTNGTLFWALNRTNTLGGSKLLRSWILNPAIDINELEERYDAVSTLLKFNLSGARLSDYLKQIADLERIAARIELNLASPAELATLRDSLVIIPEIKNILDELTISARLNKLNCNLKVPQQLLELLKNTLTESPPLSRKNGNIFRDSYNAELDRLMQIKSSSATLLMQLEVREKEKTGINSLKVRFNGVHGYYIEITKTNLDRVPSEYIRKQTTSNSERFYTEELKKMETEILSADTKLLQLEEQLYFDLLAQAKAFTISLRDIHKILAQLDVLNSFAILASEESFVRPKLDSSKNLVINAGKHPVMIQLLPGKFIANSVEFSEQKFCAILTGANMGGKSTYLRQTALLVIMAQIGSFVPAKDMQLGIVDRIFARLGASDDLLEGESTFMVEMREAAHIVSAASDSSLLLIDEIGRGTATTDGLALAQAILEWICNRIKSRCMFATHFHEITKLSDFYSCIFNLSVATIETEGRVVFTHEIKNGPANRSYGIEVAKLAGLPSALLERARKLLEQIVELKEGKELNTKQLSIFEDFNSDQVNKISENINEDLSKYNELIEKINNIDINNITPIEAMNLLVQLKKHLVKEALC